MNKRFTSLLPGLPALLDDPEGEAPAMPEAANDDLDPVLDPALYPATDDRFENKDYGAFKEIAAALGYTAAEFAEEANAWLRDAAIVTPEDAEDLAEKAAFERETAEGRASDARFAASCKEHAAFMRAHWVREAARQTEWRLADLAAAPERRARREAMDRQEEIEQAEIEAADAADLAARIAEGGAS